MNGSLDVIITALDQLFIQLIAFFPKLIITLVIWYVGKYLINLGVNLFRKVNIKGTHIDDKIISVLSPIILIAGKVLLILIVLDYWNIGKSVITALVGGLTITFSIALGLAFGKALEPDAKNLVDQIKSYLKNKK